MSSPVRFERPRTTQEQVLDELRRRILVGDVQPGQPIRPDQVAAELHVSRVPVREALKILEGEGQVQYRAHHGYALAELRRDDLVEIYRIRELLEDEAARAALPRLSAQDLGTMEAACDEMEAFGATAVAAMAVANRRFHLTLLEASGMPHLLHHIRLLWNASDHYRSVYYLDETHRAGVNDDHRRILAAAASGEVDGSLALLDAHRDRAIAGLAPALEEGATDG
ncbi:MAG: GntR family transcriptional regulator [Actinomycetota bacterium]